MTGHQVVMAVAPFAFGFFVLVGVIFVLYPWERV